MRKLFIFLIACCACCSLYAQRSTYGGNLTVYHKDGSKTAVPVSDIDSVKFVVPVTYKLSAIPTNYYTLSLPDRQEAGEETFVDVTAVADSLKAIELYYLAAGEKDPVACRLVSTKGQTTRFSFIMPAADIVLAATLDYDYHKVTSLAEHATLAMLNSVVDPDSLQRTENYADIVVRFTCTPYLGYSVDKPVVTGVESGKVVDGLWYDPEPDDLGYPPCWKFTMPDEPVVVAAKAVEKTLYADRVFTGRYRGFVIGGGENNLVTGSPTMELRLNGNTSYTLSTTDANSFNFDGCYTFDEAAGTFRYLDQYATDIYGHKDFGIEGARLATGQLLVGIHDLNVDSPNRMKYYFASQNAVTGYVCASTNQWATNSLIEVTTQGFGSKHYWFERETQRLTPVSVAFTGAMSSIGGAGTAYVDYDGGVYKYQLTEGASPVFTKAGSERGTYHGDKGDLTLDGFGQIMLNGDTATYTIQGNVVTTTLSGLVVKINPSTMTYVQATPDAWDGPLSFYAEGEDIGCYLGSVGKGSIALWLDQKFNGQYEKGRAKIVVIATQDGMEKDFVATTSPYEYDAANHKLTLTKVYAATEPGQANCSLVFEVSADKQSLACTSEKIYPSRGTGNTYVVLKGVQLKATEK